jgi:hypothetical protein
MPLAPEATPLRKLPQIWKLAGVTYALVILTTIAAVFAYKHYWPNADASEIELEKRSARISVGDVWIPVYPDAIHQSSSSSTRDGVVVGDARFISADPPAKLMVFYRTRLRGDNKVAFTSTGNGGKIEAVAKRGKRLVRMVFSTSGAGCETELHTESQNKP